MATDRSRFFDIVLNFVIHRPEKPDYECNYIHFGTTFLYVVPFKFESIHLSKMKKLMLI